MYRFTCETETLTSLCVMRFLFRVLLSCNWGNTCIAMFITSDHGVVHESVPKSKAIEDQTSVREERRIVGGGGD
ncbi:hypothetical protein L6452_26610 [Arctium lappa]|uniref:Uncharacterized protein n=1 Tax=Arctium lappa TaxID=4217 RepID=A0ACB8ZWC3_ARCLA|nr:hypothetical protein L6452_26610 [Arctium lappa]